MEECGLVFSYSFGDKAEKVMSVKLWCRIAASYHYEQIAKSLSGFPTDTWVNFTEGRNVDKAELLFVTM